MRYRIIFSYDGTLFQGYQKQPGKRSVQGEIETVLRKLNHDHDVHVCASGRTDAGVHACGQVAHIDFLYEVDDFQKRANSLLPPDIYIHQVMLVDSSFHARFSVKKKEYCYKINCGEYLPFQRNYVYQYGRSLCLDKMQQALSYLIGTHNFRSFAKTDATREDYVRTILEARLEEKNGIVSITFVGTGFFRYMIRNMVGTLIEIGEGKRAPEDILEILKKENRIYAGKTAPPEGLYLMNVTYE